MVLPVGKIKLIPPPHAVKIIDLWSEQTRDTEGRLRLSEVCRALDGDVIAYVDEDGCEVLISAHERGPLKGLSTDVFKCDQELVVISKKTPGVSMSGRLLEAQEKFKKLAAMQNRLKDQMVEMDEILKRLGKGWVKV